MRGGVNATIPFVGATIVFGINSTSAPSFIFTFALMVSLCSLYLRLCLSLATKGRERERRDKGRYREERETMCGAHLKFNYVIMICSVCFDDYIYIYITRHRIHTIWITLFLKNDGKNKPYFTNIIIDHVSIDV